MKAKTLFYCTECGNETPKWAGRCSVCGAWNSIVEQPEEKKTAGKGRLLANMRTVKAESIIDLSSDEEIRFSTGMGELDRVLGGGAVKGSLVLVGGAPGIGKSTLMLQICGKLSENAKILYVSGEESPRQLKLRADRLGVQSDNLYVLSETCLGDVLQSVEEEKPDVLIVDSIQTLYSSDLESAPGSVTQVRECSARLTRLAKTTGAALIFVGHVTKDGALAGPRVLEHIVDTVLYFEGDTHSNFRLIRAFKNRFGAVNELGVFAMTDRGLRAVSNPSAIFLSEHRNDVAGSVVMVTQEGSRPLLVEIQALADESHSPAPRRLCVGLDAQRLAMLLAVLHRHAGISCFEKDVFVNAVGGVKITEPASDLAVLMAVASSLSDRPLPAGTVIFGEVGLTGEIRPIPRGQDRLKEAAKLGFSMAIIPKANAPKTPIEGLDVKAVDRLTDALAVILD